MLGYLRTAPWRRGPLLLLRRPGVFLAPTAACFVATLPAAAAGPFVSASRHATLRDEIRQACPSFVGDWITNAPAPPVRADASSDADFRSTVTHYHDVIRNANTAATGILSPGTATQIVPSLTADDSGIDVVDRPGLQHNVTVLAGPSGSGVWVPDSYAGDAHVKVGSTMPLPGRDRTRRRHPRRGHLPRPAIRAAPTVLVRTDSLLERADRLYRRAAADDPGRRSTPRSRPGSPPSRRPVRRPALPRVFVSADTTDDRRGQARRRRDRRRERGARDQPNAAGADRSVAAPTSTSDLRNFLPRADLAGDVMRPAIAPITGVGVGVGLAVVAAAGVFWVLRRRKD